MNRNAAFTTSATLAALLAASSTALAWPGYGRPHYSTGPEVSDPGSCGETTGNRARWERLGGGPARTPAPECTVPCGGAAASDGSGLEGILGAPQLPRWRM